MAQFISHVMFKINIDFNTYDRTAVDNNWNNDALKILYFHSFLQGAANIWYKKYKATNPESDW